MLHLIHQIPDQAATKYPNHPIFRFDDQSLTYAEFVARTNRLAHFLVAQGIKKGDRVGIHLHKSMESVIAVYGILKAGGAYVPLDPALTNSRLAFVIQDCGIELIVSQSRKLDNLKIVAQTATNLRCVIGPALPAGGAYPFEIADWGDVEQMRSDEPPVVVGLMEQDLAYIMYTSGSTGNPKGMMHTHHSGLSYALYAADLYELTHDDVLSNHSPLHFDMSTFDIFSGPSVGATTVIIPEEYKMLPASLSELIQDEGITVWYSVTTALVELLLNGSLEHRELSHLRWVNFGGEPFPPIHLTNLMQQLPKARFSNVYGPAEVNQCTYFHVPPLPNKYAEEYVPIGVVWEIADSLVLNEAGDPVEPGEPGELLIAAPTRMQGYWNRPDLTDKGFYRQRPFPGSPYEKIFYRTGDLVQLDEDNWLKFLGRKDRQIKVRGYRVELDEVEANLTAHPAVAEVAAYPLKRSENGDDLLIGAAVLPKVGQSITVDLLNKHIRSRLPAYACPSDIVIRDKFPRTGSGKINRRLLMQMAQEGDAQDPSQSPSQSP